MSWVRLCVCVAVGVSVSVSVSVSGSWRVCVLGSIYFSGKQSLLECLFVSMCVERGGGCSLCLREAVCVRVCVSVCERERWIERESCVCVWQGKELIWVEEELYVSQTDILFST